MQPRTECAVTGTCKQTMRPPSRHLQRQPVGHGHGNYLLASCEARGIQGSGADSRSTYASSSIDSHCHACFLDASHSYSTAVSCSCDSFPLSPSLLFENTSIHGSSYTWEYIYIYIWSDVSSRGLETIYAGKA